MIRSESLISPRSSEVLKGYPLCKEFRIGVRTFGVDQSVLARNI